MIQVFKKLSKNPFFQGSVFLTIANILTSFLNYLFNILAARALGPAVYGDITTLFSYLTILSVPINVAVAILIQKISSHSATRIEYTLNIERWMYKKLQKRGYVLFLMLALIPFIPSFTNLSPAAGYALIPLLLLTMLLSFYDAALQGIRTFFLFAFLSVIATTLKVTGSVLVSFNIDGINTIIIFLFASVIVKYAVSFHILHSQNNKAQSEPIKKGIRELLKDRYIWITTLSLFALYVLNNIDIIFVKKYFSDTQAGIYSSWSLFAKMIMYFAGPLISISYIFFASSDQKKHHHKAFLYSTYILVAISVCSFLFYSLFGDLIISLFFGEKYISILPFLPHAGIFGSIYLMIFYVNQYFLSQRSRYALILPVIVPFYILALVFITKNIEDIIYMNIYFSSSIIITYFVAITKHFKKHRVQ